MSQYTDTSDANKTTFVTDDVAERPRVPRPTPVVSTQPTATSGMNAANPGGAQVDHGTYGSMISCLGGIAGTLGSIPCCFCCPNPYRSVQQGSIGLVSRFGEYDRSVPAGLVKVNPFSEKLRVVDVKIQIANIPRQQAMTKDNVAIDIDSVIYYHIVDPYKAAFGISDIRLALIERSQTTLRDVIGSRNLQSVLTDREATAAEIETIVEGVADHWGVKVESILIKDINFSVELQQSLSSAAQAKRIGESKVIAARAEVDSAKLMREAADILASPAALQIRQLEALQSMSRSANAKVIFVPMNLFNAGDAQSSFSNTALLEKL